MRYGLTEIMNNHRWFIMGLAMISVVMFHQPWFTWGVFDFFHHVGFYGVEVFLFVSGWGIYHSLSRNSLRQYFKNRMVRIMPACIMIGIVQSVLCACGWDNGVCHPLAFVLMCLGLFKWYIYAILIYYALAPWIYQVLQRKGYVFWLMMIGVIAAIVVCRKYEAVFGISLLSVFPNIFYRYPSFLLGMWMARQDRSFSLWTKVGLLPGILCLYMANGGFSSYYSGIWGSLIFIAFIPLLICFVSSVARYLAYFRIYQWICSMGMCSLEIYLWHEFYFRGIYRMVFCPFPIQVLTALLLTIVSVWGIHHCTILLKERIIFTY